MSFGWLSSGCWARCSGPAVASAETGATPLRLDVAASKGSYVAGEAVTLRFTLTNQGSAPWQVVAMADGTVDVTALTKDGKAFTPTFLGQSHYFGYEQATAGALTTVNIVSASVAYTLAPITGATPAACAGVTSVATVAFTVGPAGSRGFPWLWVILGAAGLLVLILVVLFLVRRGRTRAAAFAVLAMLTAAGLTVTEPRHASAELVVGGAGTEFATRANGCLYHELTNAFDAAKGNHRSGPCKRERENECPGGPGDPVGERVPPPQRHATARKL